MNNLNGNNEKEQKGGFLSALTGLFKGGAAAGGAPGMGAAGGLFATKAGIVGMVLGGATIAAGVGVVYNFVGSSSKPVYSPELFQNSYYEEEAASASQQRAQAKDRSSASASTLDLFREQAQKDGLGLGGEAGGAPKEAAAAAEPNNDQTSSSAEAPSVDPAGPGPAGGSARLAPGSGFGGGSSMRAGSTASAMPRMQNQGGMSGGIGGSFAKMYQPPAGKDGRIGGMTASRAGAKSSPKYAVPFNNNKRGAFGQAKFAAKQGVKAAYSSDGSSMRSTAETAFTGETGIGGDVPGGDGGAGLGGAGISQGASLKGNDPNLNTSSFTAPEIPDLKKTEDVSPWNDLLNDIMKMGLGVLGGLAGIWALGKASKTAGPWGTVAYIAAMALAAAAMVTIGFMVAKAIKILKGEKGTNDKIDEEGDWAGQTMMGVGILYACTMLAMKVWDAAMGLERPDAKLEGKMETTTGVDGKPNTYTVDGKATNGDGYPIDGKGNRTSSAPLGDLGGVSGKFNLFVKSITAGI